MRLLVIIGDGADVAEVYVSSERCADVCWRGKEIRLLKDEEKKILKRLREVTLISEKTQLPSLRKVNVKELKQTVEFVKSVIDNFINNSITEINNFLYAGAYVILKNLGKWKKTRALVEEENSGKYCGMEKRCQLTK